MEYLYFYIRRINFGLKVFNHCRNKITRSKNFPYSFFNFYNTTEFRRQRNSKNNTEFSFFIFHFFYSLHFLCLSVADFPFYIHFNIIIRQSWFFFSKVWNFPKNRQLQQKKHKTLRICKKVLKLTLSGSQTRRKQ